MMNTPFKHLENSTWKRMVTFCHPIWKLFSFSWKDICCRRT